MLAFAAILTWFVAVASDTSDDRARIVDAGPDPTEVLNRQTNAMDGTTDFDYDAGPLGGLGDAGQSLAAAPWLTR